MNTLPVPGFCGSNMQMLRENWELRVGGSRRGLPTCSCSELTIQTTQHLRQYERRKYIGIYCPPFAASLSRTTDHQYRTPGYIRPFVGPTGFPDFGRWGWTNQADRLPWRPYGLIRANIISEDARKNRRISENSFGQRSLDFFSFLCPSSCPSSFLGSSSQCTVALEKNV